MNPSEILHEIVATEQQAREMYAETIRRKEGFSEYLEAKKLKLREEGYRKADEELAAVKEREAARADAEISELELKFDKELARVRALFEAGKEDFAERIFDMVVNADAQ